MFSERMLEDMAQEGRENTGASRWNFVYLLGEIANQLERIADALASQGGGR